MIGPDRMDRVTAAACVPEQLVAYVAAVAGSRPILILDCVGWVSGSRLVLVGYPLHDPRDSAAMSAAVDAALDQPGLEHITVIGPNRPPQAPKEAVVAQDGYYALPVPPPVPHQKLRNLLRRAGRELTIVPMRHLEEDHTALVQRYLDERRLTGGTRRIFEQLPSYLRASDGSRVVSARLADGRLAAFGVGEFAAFETAFFMFSFRDPELAPPGSADLVLSELIEEAHRHGQTRMNLGLGVNSGIRFFKRKWGATPFLPYVETRWKVQRRGFISTLRRFVRKSAL
jgi:hypothetical protein